MKNPLHRLSVETWYKAFIIAGVGIMPVAAHVRIAGRDPVTFFAFGLALFLIGAGRWYWNNPECGECLERREREVPVRVFLMGGILFLTGLLLAAYCAAAALRSGSDTPDRPIKNPGLQFKPRHAAKRHQSGRQDTVFNLQNGQKIALTFAERQWNTAQTAQTLNFALAQITKICALQQTENSFKCRAVPDIKPVDQSAFKKRHAGFAEIHGPANQMLQNQKRNHADREPNHFVTSDWACI